MPRASWRGYLRLSLVSCPIYLSPAMARTKPIRLHQVWRAASDEGDGELEDQVGDKMSPNYRRRGVLRITSRIRRNECAPQLGSPFCLTIPAPVGRSTKKRLSKDTNTNAANTSPPRRTN